MWTSSTTKRLVLPRHRSDTTAIKAWTGFRRTCKSDCNIYTEVQRAKNSQGNSQERTHKRVSGCVRIAPAHHTARPAVRQGFSALSTLWSTLWTRAFFVVGLSCILAGAQQQPCIYPLDANSTALPPSTAGKTLGTPPNVPRGRNRPQLRATV